MQALILTAALLLGNPICDCSNGGTCYCGQACQCDQAAYAVKSRLARAQGKALVIFVGCPQRTIEGVVSVRLRSFEGSARPRVIPCWQEGDWFRQPTVALPPIATDQEIRATARIARQPELTLPQVQPRVQAQPIRFIGGGAQC